jgi:hypothetical protein
MKFLDRVLIKIFMFLRSLFGVRPRNRVDKIHQIEEFLYVIVQGCLGENELYCNIDQLTSLTPVIRIRCPTLRVLSSWKSFESSFFTEPTLRKSRGRVTTVLTPLALIYHKNFPTARPIEDGRPVLIASSVVERLVSGEKNVELELGKTRYSFVMKDFVLLHDSPGSRFSEIWHRANLGCPSLKLANPIHDR